MFVYSKFILRMNTWNEWAQCFKYMKMKTNAQRMRKSAEFNLCFHLSLSFRRLVSVDVKCLNLCSTFLFPFLVFHSYSHQCCFFFSLSLHLSLNSSRGFTIQSRRSRKRKWHPLHGVQWKRSNSTSMWYKVWKNLYWNVSKSIKYPVCMSSIRLYANHGINLAPKKMYLHRDLHAICNKHLPIYFNAVRRTRAKLSAYWIYGKRIMCLRPK